MKKILLVTCFIASVQSLPSKDVPLLATAFVIVDMNGSTVSCLQVNTDYRIGFGMAFEDKRACACLSSLTNATLLSSSCQDVYTSMGQVSIAIWTVRYNGGGPMGYTAIPGCCSSGCTPSTAYGTPGSGSTPGC